MLTAKINTNTIASFGRSGCYVFLCVLNSPLLPMLKFEELYGECFPARHISRLAALASPSRLPHSECGLPSIVAESGRLSGGPKAAADNFGGRESARSSERLGQFWGSVGAGPCAACDEYKDLGPIGRNCQVSCTT